MGAATPRHLPHGRGYDTSLGYINGPANDYWDQRVWGGRPMGYVDLWATDRPAWGQNTSCRLGQCHPASVPVAYGGASGHKGGIGAAYSLGPDEIYEETLLRQLPSLLQTSAHPHQPLHPATVPAATAEAAAPAPATAPAPITARTRTSHPSVRV